MGRVEAGARFGHVGQRWLLDRAVETDGEVANLEAAYDAAVQEHRVAATGHPEDPADHLRRHRHHDGPGPKLFSGLLPLYRGL